MKILKVYLDNTHLLPKKIGNNLYRRSSLAVVKVSSHNTHILYINCKKICNSTIKSHKERLIKTSSLLFMKRENELAPVHIFVYFVFTLELPNQLSNFPSQKLQKQSISKENYQCGRVVPRGLGTVGRSHRESPLSVPISHDAARRAVSK